jgi:hypothetical protein
MTAEFAEVAELRRLLDAVCEESATAALVRRLEALVLARPEAAVHYVQFMGLFADLSRHFAGPLVPRTEVALHGRRAGR